MNLSTRSLGAAMTAVLFISADHTCFARLASMAAEDGPKVRRDVDSETGRSLLNYPPHLSADIQHIALRLSIPNMNERRLEGEATLRFSPIQNEITGLRLHAAGLNISSVIVQGTPAVFKVLPEDETIAITLPTPVTRGSSAEAVITYRVIDPAEGLYWSPANPQRPNELPQLHSQGESELNRYWFPCHDFPNDRCSSEIIITVPAGFQAISNGKLVQRSSDRTHGTETFHWRQTRAHPAYLMSLVVGQFDVVDVGRSALSMPVYVPPGRKSDAGRTFARTPDMVDMMACLTGEPYPWEKYAQVVVRNFGWGGMENTSATTLFEGACQSKESDTDGTQDSLIVHELAHQWFGNLLTCRSWEHIWLNEGFATYSEALWEQYQGNRFEARRSTSSLRANVDAYDATIWQWAREAIENDQADAPFQPAMASKQYRHPDDVFDREANPYPKGALVLHMLRATLGDEIFFRGLQQYVRTYKDQSVETYQFRVIMEQVSGRSLQRFFDQWVFRPGVPSIRISRSWEPSTKQLTISVEQTQTINGDNPAFALRIPIWVKMAGASDYRILDITTDQRSLSKSFSLDSEPVEFVVDPKLDCLARFETDFTTTEALSQMRSGPTLIARLRATAALGRSPQDATPDVVKGLTELVIDIKRPKELRSEAAKSLGAIALGESGRVPAHQAAAQNLVSMLLQTRGESSARIEVIKQVASASPALAGDDRQDAIGRLRTMAQSDRSIQVRAESLKALAALQPDGVLADLRRGLESASDFDRIAVAAVESLAFVPTPESLALAISRTSSAYRSNVRSAAVKSVGSLWAQDPSRAIQTLRDILSSDADVRTREAAGTALASINDPSARAAIEQFASSARGRSWKADAARWLEESAHTSRSQ